MERSSRHSTVVRTRINRARILVPAAIAAPLVVAALTVEGTTESTIAVALVAVSGLIAVLGLMYFYELRIEDGHICQLRFVLLTCMPLEGLIVTQGTARPTLWSYKTIRIAGTEGAIEVIQDVYNDEGLREVVLKLHEGGATVDEQVRKAFNLSKRS